ncbi:MAG: hypothetical protein D6784_18345 [Chloroflexi bacterium]|nr:MAG: hypothetical protein D6784_18345 [Chloroflexota bacterium]
MRLFSLFSKSKNAGGPESDESRPIPPPRPATRPFPALHHRDSDYTRPSRRITDSRWNEIQQAIDKAG